MIEINTWLNTFLQALQDTFGERLWLVGLQGSYGRGEATESSDIDLVVILDALTLEDIRQYNALLDTMSDREKICGFLSGKSELLNWEASDLFQFYYDTTSLKGTLRFININCMTTPAKIATTVLSTSQIIFSGSPSTR